MLEFLLNCFFCNREIYSNYFIRKFNRFGVFLFKLIFFLDLNCQFDLEIFGLYDNRCW